MGVGSRSTPLPELHPPSLGPAPQSPPYALMTLDGLGGQAQLAMSRQNYADMRAVYDVMLRTNGAEKNIHFIALHEMLAKRRCARPDPSLNSA
ncbi:hypothetical protein HaLaN_33143 [Haematococcus lacustris]|uniref:Uncharacterized protein n=1 Tax=Haematococcus lacustris TaxID=44745 RepID=A0A6A0AN73_HAELA|nr:hypothetical protein HaLaN_33143 [Haematococcus lacustris]